mmetsp:Transcript_58013/g.164846  ORF Transcript_58013/g.164846 Transcript_58013/m.164846 type:complete len:367 (-) Transcript_58013:114-1214(-)
MLDAWNSWEVSQATDPRRALLRQTDLDAKRRRLGDGLAGAEAWGGGPGTGMAALAPLGGPAGPADDDITARIVNALKNHLSPDGSSGGVPPGPGPAAEPELSARLLDSLRTLPVEVCRGSEAGQELFRHVQSLAPPQPALPPCGEMLALPAPQPQALDNEVAPHSAGDNEPKKAQFAAPRPPPSPREDDESSEEGVPHRLPPGFGAIPEDIVEERARQREEERVLRLKATQPCRFGRRCKRRDCPNAHPEGRDIDTSLNPCAFGRRCKRKGCFYDHPEGRVIDDDPSKGMCKFGTRCSRPDCLYDHPDGRAPLTGPDPRICYFCHDPGHIASDCPRNPESWNYNREAERERQTATQEQQKAIAAPS